MKKLQFILGIHCHQPVGNFDSVFAMAFDRAYRPFLDRFEATKTLKLVVHVSGCLLDWIRANRPEWLERLRALVAAGRVEMLTGGYYEPILPAITESDAVGQIRKLTKTLKSDLGADARGLWLTERVWEPRLPRVLRAAGVEYSIVDDAHFLRVGIPAERLDGYYLTEDGGDAVAVFSISQPLRYQIPFAPPEQVIDSLRQAATVGGDRVLVMMDDGEKFGVWPDTYDLVYGEQWLERFFAALERERDWLQTTTFQAYREANGPRGRIYLPAASYEEMMSWARGTWRTFLVKYPESNHLHKRVLALSRRLSDLPQSPARARALDELWQAECNCAYWHGVFGGLYLPHLRSALYRHLIAAEAQADGLSRRPTAVEVVDIDLDGADEWLLRSAEWTLCLQPGQGGAAVEWDHRPARVNLLNTLARREEASHTRLREHLAKVGAAAGVPGGNADPGVKTIHDMVRTKEAGLDRYLTYDWYRRGGWIDHWLHPGTRIESFAQCAYGEQGDFVNQPYEAVATSVRRGRPLWPASHSSRPAVPSAPQTTLRRQGSVWVEGQLARIEIEKVYTLETDGRLTVAYRVRRISAGPPVDLWFGVEVNLGGGDAQDPEAGLLWDGKPLARWREASERSGVVRGVLRDRGWGLELDWRVEPAAVVWQFPVETVSLSESGFERSYQGSGLLFHWRLRLGEGETWPATFTVSGGAGKR